MQAHRLAVGVKHKDRHEILMTFLFVLNNSALTAQACLWKGSREILALEMPRGSSPSPALLVASHFLLPALVAPQRVEAGGADGGNAEEPWGGRLWQDHGAQGPAEQATNPESVTHQLQDLSTSLPLFESPFQYL